MKVLFITNHYLFLNNGGSNATKFFLHAFSRLYSDISLIYPEQGNNSDIFIPTHVRKYPCYDSRSNIRKGIDIYRGHLNRYEKFVPFHIKENKYDIVIIDHSVVATGIFESVKKSGAKIITIHHNVERDYLKDNLPSLVYRYPYIYFTNKAETETLISSCINLCVTPADCQEFQSWYKDIDLHTHYIGVFEYKTIEKKIMGAGTGYKSFVISGSLYFSQSNRPVLEFIKRYYPIIKEICPNWTLEITGRNPSAEIKQACANDIILVPNPENMAIEIAKSSVYICPINGGSGLKLRIMDGLRLGLPVICHHNSVAGYEAIKEAGYLFEYYDEVTFRHALSEVISRKFDRQRVYDSYYANFSIEAGTERLRKILVAENLIQ